MKLYVVIYDAKHAKNPVLSPISPISSTHKTLKEIQLKNAIKSKIQNFPKLRKILNSCKKKLVKIGHIAAVLLQNENKNSKKYKKI